MITRYNNYITKDVEVIKEKVEISIKGLLDKAKQNTEEVRKTIIHNSITADKQPVKIGGEYYAVFYLSEQPDFYRVGKVKIDNIVEKKKADSDKTYKVFKYKKVSIDSPLQKKEKVEGSEEEKLIDTRLRDYKLLVSEKSAPKLSSGEITGFYLYKEKIENKEIKDIIKRYGYKEEEPKSDVEVKAGNVYEITNKQGNRIDLTVYSIDKNGILTGYDYENKQKYDNQKVSNLKDPKLKGSVADKYKEKIKTLYIDSWQYTPEFKDIQKSEEQIKFIEGKKEEMEKLRDKLAQFHGNEDVQKLIKSANAAIQQMNKKMGGLKNPKADAEQGTLPLKDKKGGSKKGSKKSATKKTDTNPNPTEEPDTNVADNDEQKTVDDMEKGEKSANKVQAQGEMKDKEKDKERREKNARNKSRSPKSSSAPFDPMDPERFPDRTG